MSVKQSTSELVVHVTLDLFLMFLIDEHVEVRGVDYNLLITYLFFQLFRIHGL